jgi:hypothetical protein
LEDVAFEIPTDYHGSIDSLQLRDTPTAQALIREGEDAVEPLLRVLESDDRLSRYDLTPARYSWGLIRTLAPVHLIASHTLVAILDAEAIGAAGRGPNRDKREVRNRYATDLRDYWSRVKGLSRVERWYRTLADDQATAEQWLEAASRIVEPIGAKPLGYRRPPELRRPPSKELGLAGEELRAKANPSVSELMARRTDRVANANVGGEDPAPAIAGEMALYLAQWDERQALQVLRTMSLRLRAAPLDDGHNVGHQSPAGLFNQVTLARHRSADPKALDEYADWMRTVGRPARHDHKFSPFEVIWRHPDHPSIARLAEWAFNAPESPWMQPGRDLDFNESSLLESPLLGVASYRKHVLRLLDDKTPAGSATLTTGGGLCLEFGPQHRLSTGYSPDPLAPRIGIPVKFRVCDYYAWWLSRLEGVPRCAIYWPQAKRDEARSEIVAYLKQYGARYGFTDSQEDESPWTIRACFTLPPLDHPASAEDVRQGLAIFSLEGQGERRLVPLAPRPRHAKWLTLKSSPCVAYQSKDLVGPPKNEYYQYGFVWQAEEVLKEGQWVRYYGFVGPNVLARAPASEIQFTNESGQPIPPPD